MEIGIDSFAAISGSASPNAHEQAMSELLERIVAAENAGFDLFGVGEHHRAEFLDSAPSLILAAAAAQTQRIRLTSAVTVLSAADPVRVFQQYATLDLISKGRAEIVAGRGSFSEAFPLFGYDLSDYDELFDEKLALLLKIRDTQPVTWSGTFRAPLLNQAIYPRPLQSLLPIWVGVGGSPASCERAGRLGLPLMIAIIGGQTKRFRSLVDQYQQTGHAHGHDPQQLKVGMHALCYVEKDSQAAKERFYPGYAEVFTKIGKERGWPPVTRAHFDRQVDQSGALLVGSPAEVADKLHRHSQDLGGLSRVTFQMNVAALSHDQLLKSINLMGDTLLPSLQAL